MSSFFQSKSEVPQPTLTEAQLRVMREWLKPGCTWRDVADALCVSEGTVRTHLAAIYNRLGVASRKEAAAEFNRLYPPFPAPELAQAC